jgi:YidC/Oxa1 family membrane protein insertase
LAEFNNPQQEPGMERRLLLVFALTFLIIMLFQPLLKKYGPQPPAKPESPPPVAQNQAQLPAQSPTPPTRQTAAEHGAAGMKAAPVQATSESETVVENDVYRIVFTNQGARVKSWVLKKYTDDKGGQLELVNAAAAEKYGYPLTLWSYDEGLRSKLNSALYVAEPLAPTLPQSARKDGAPAVSYFVACVRPSSYIAP